MMPTLDDLNDLDPNAPLLNAAKTAKDNADLENKLKTILKIEGEPHEDKQKRLNEAKKQAIEALAADAQQKVDATLEWLEVIKDNERDVQNNLNDAKILIDPMNPFSTFSRLSEAKEQYNKLNMLVRVTGNFADYFADSTNRANEYNNVKNQYETAQKEYNTAENAVKQQISILNLTKQKREVCEEANNIAVKALAILNDPAKQDYDEILKQRAIIDVAYARAKSESKSAVPDVNKLKPATTGFVEHHTDTKMITRIRRNVTDRALEAKNVTLMLNPGATQTSGALSVNVVDSNKADAAYHHVHLDDTKHDISQSYADLGYGNVLYIETDNTNKVTSRSTYCKDEEEAILAAKEVAYQLAMKAIDKALSSDAGKKGEVEFQIDGKDFGRRQQGITREKQVNLMYAALLDLGKEHFKNVKITTKGVVEKCGPKDAMLYGNNNEAFIREQLGDSTSDRRARQKLFSAETKALRAAMKGQTSQLEGSITSTKKPGM